jgi:hypothetical protein
MSKEKKYKPKIQTAKFSDTSAAVDADSHRSWLVGSNGLPVEPSRVIFFYLT